MILSDGGVVPPEAGESNLLRQDDVYRVFRLFLAAAASFSQQVLPLLPDELAVLGICQPRLTAAKKHNACSTQDNQTGEQCQQAEADKLTMRNKDTGRVNRLLQRDLEQVPLGWSEQFVEGMSREGVVLWSQSKHSVHRLGSSRLGSAPRSVLQGARGTCKPFLANTPEGSIRLTDTGALVGTGPAGAGGEAGGVVTRETRGAVWTDTCESQAMICTVPAIEARVRLAAVSTDLTEVSRKSRGA